MPIRPSPLAGALGALMLVLAVGGAAFAQAGGLTDAQVTAKLKAAGYADVHGVKREGSHFDADASKNGKSVHLHVDAATGAVTPVSREQEEDEEEPEEKTP